MRLVLVVRATWRVGCVVDGASGRTVDICVRVRSFGIVGGELRDLVRSIVCVGAGRVV